MKNFRSGGNLLLEEYLQRDDFNICINFPMYTDNNNLLVDKVVKYENFVEDLGKVFKELNIPFEGTLNIKAKSEYRSSRKPYQQVFSEEQKEIIGRAFEQEIVMHGYKY